MKTILLPTDFSDNSWNAITYAIQLYKDEKCLFLIFHTYTPVVYNIEYVLVSPAQFGLGDVIRNASEMSLSNILADINKEFIDNPNHTFETVSRFNTLIPGIKELMDERPIDLIVMGTKGATGANEILFGSNTVQVFKSIKCPILAIPSDFIYEAPNNILFPSDLKVNYSDIQMQIVSEIAMLHHARINVLHVSTGDDLTEAQNVNKQQLESIIKVTPYLFHDVESMEVPDAISKFQVKHKINLLSMVNNKHSIFENLFFKNTINQMGFHLNIPFLVIPSK